MTVKGEHMTTTYHTAEQAAVKELQDQLDTHAICWDTYEDCMVSLYKASARPAVPRSYADAIGFAPEGYYIHSSRHGYAIRHAEPPHTAVSFPGGWWEARRHLMVAAMEAVL